MPKYHWLPFLLECISGSRVLSLFLVAMGAAIKVASTAVPVFRTKPRLVKISLTVARIFSVSLCFSSRCLKRRVVDSSGRRDSSGS